MHLSRIKSYKQLINKIFSAISMIIFIVVALAPENALAFEAELSISPSTLKFVAPAITEGCDPYLAKIVNNPQSLKEKSNVETKNEIRKNIKIALVKAPKNDASIPVVMEGEASFYSRAGCLGCNPLRIMANGQPLDDNALTMAIGADKKHLVGYKAKVTNLVTNKSVNVLITDTGGFYKEKYGNRVADLTIATKTAIGMYGGVGQVRVEVY